MQLVWQLLVSSLIFLVLSKIIKGFEIKDFKTAVIVAIIYGVLMMFAGALVSPLKFIGEALVGLVSWIPVIGKLADLSMVIVSFLLKFIIGSIMLCFTDVIIKGFKMRSFALGIFVAFIISVINCFLPMW